MLIPAAAVAVVATACFAVLKGLLWNSDRATPKSSVPQLWTDKFDQLQLSDTPVVGRLNGWDFHATHGDWKGTRLTLRQDGGTPQALRLEITFPLKGGELVSGKTYQLRTDDPPFASPVKIVWKDKDGETESRPFPSGYLLWVQFDEVTKRELYGRIHLCLPDPTRSWVAGSFSAEVETKVR